MDRCFTTPKDFSGRDFYLDTDSGGDPIIRSKKDVSFYDGTGNAPVGPSDPTSPPSNPSDSGILIEKWDDYTRYWQYDGTASTWTLLGDVAVGGGVTDHGGLTGLGDDDHTQYHNDARGDARYYTKTLLDTGQLDTRYYTEAETDALLLGKSDVGHTHPASDITDFDTEVSNNVDVAANTAARHSHSNKALLDTYTQTEADLADAVSKKHDAVTVADSSELDFTLTGQQITASIIAGSIDETKLDVSTNASLDLADSAVQPGDNISVLTNDAGYVSVGDNVSDLVNDAGYTTNTGTVTSVGITPTDGIQVDSGSPVTGSGSITLGINASALRSHINVENGAQVNTVDSVNSQTGAVVLDADDIDDTSTTNKFVTAAEKSDIASAVQPGDNVSGLTNDANYVAYLPDGGIALTGQFEQALVNHGTQGSNFNADCSSGNIHELTITATIAVTLQNLQPGTIHTFVVYSSGGGYGISFSPYLVGSSRRDYSTTMNSNAYYVYRITVVSSTNIFVSRTGPFS